MAKRSGVNIFTSVGLAVLAHELNHTINEDVVKLGGSFTLDARKRFLLASAAGSDVIFYPETYRFNKKATQENFKAKGYWDGLNDHWDRDWLAYWKVGPGKEHNLNWLRQAGPLEKRGIPFFIQAPQEIIAGFSNIYFADSEALLQTAISKWHNGYKEPINQFLFFAQLYTMGTKKTRFYKQDPNKYVIMEQVYISRDSNGYINSLKVNDRRYLFTLNEMGQVQSIAIQ